MIRTDQSQMIEGVTVYPDSDKWWVYYLLPSQPNFRRNSNGDPNFSFFKYRFPVDRPDGKVGGGYVLFDVAFVVPPEKMDPITTKVQQQIDQEAARRNTQPKPVEFGTLQYLDGSCSLIIAGADGALVQKVHNSGKPSLFGENTATFGVELTTEGATFFEQAMQGQGPSIGIQYELQTIAKLPPIVAKSHFHAHKFYSFHQTVDTDWRFWGEDSRDEKIRELATDSESVTMDFDWGAVTDAAVQQQIQQFVMDTTTAAIERKILAEIAPVTDDKRELPDGIEDMTVDIQSRKISNFSLTFTDKRPVEWTIYPNGPLPSFASLRDKDGNPYQWSDFARTIDLNDPAFRKLRVDVRANADFANLPIHSVEVKLDYAGRQMPNLEPDAPEGEVVLTSPDDLGKFATFIENGNQEYSYSYQVNYTNQQRIYQSETKTTNEGNLTIGIADVGILDVQIAVGDINWNDVTSALVVFTYEDTGVEPIEHQFTLNPNKLNHRITEVIFEPMRQNYQYQVKYFMKDGSEVLSDVMESRAPNLFINDVFSANRTISVNGVGDFNAHIANVFVDLLYDDAANNHHATRSVVLNAGSPMNRWVLPVISATGGELSYSGTVTFKDGSSDVIPRTVAESDTILLPKPADAFLEVMILPDLVDWSAIKLATVKLTHTDPESGVPNIKTFVFSPAKREMQTWRIPLKNAADTSYSSTITYFMTAGGSQVVGPDTSTDQTIVLDPATVA